MSIPVIVDFPTVSRLSLLVERAVLLAAVFHVNAAVNCVA